MRILFLIYCIVTLYLKGLPRSDFITEDIELEFGFFSTTKGKNFNVQPVVFNYTVAVRQGSHAKELIAVIRNINYSPNRIQRLTVNDISALQYPFLIMIDIRGELQRIVTLRKETRMSLQMKSDLLDLLVYSHDKLFQHLRTAIFRNKTIQTELDQTLLGNCLANVTGSQTTSSYIVNLTADRTFCEGPVQFSKMLDSRKLKISDDSTLEKKVEVDKVFKELKKSSMITRLHFNAERAKNKRNFGHVRMGLDISYRLEFLRAVLFKKKINTAQFRVSFSREQLLYDL